MMRLHSTGPALAFEGLGVAASSLPPPRKSGRAVFPADEFRELWLTQDPRELRRARWLAEMAAAEHGLDQGETFRFTFAVNEAVANSIEHGAASPDGYIMVRASSNGDDLSFEVHDWGTFTPPGLAEADALPERGRGLGLMASMVDSVDITPDSDGTIVRLVVRAGSASA